MSSLAILTIYALIIIAIILIAIISNIATGVNKERMFLQKDNLGVDPLGMLMYSLCFINYAQTQPAHHPVQIRPLHTPAK